MAPVVGDRLRFRYPAARRFCHRFYTSWPGNGGVAITRLDSDVDLRGTVIVEEVREIRHRGHDYVAIRFFNPRDGMEMWTNYSKDRNVWMLRVPF